MAAMLRSLPPIGDFFPPTPQAYQVLSTIFKSIPLSTVALWTPLRHYQSMGKTSNDSKFNLPGRYAWALAEAVGPINLLWVLYTLPSKLAPRPNSPTSIIGTGLPLQYEIMGLLYVLHYVNRAGVTPLLLAPSMSPIHPRVSVSMMLFQWLNSTVLASWIVYSALADAVSSSDSKASIFSPLAIVGLSLWIFGLAGNVVAENKLFSLRRGAARRKAKAEGKAKITYDKVYVIPPAEGLFKSVLFPHYSLEWIEWIGYYILGAAWGMGWGYGRNAAVWFVANEMGTMMPRAWSGVEWYEKKFGKKAVAGRTGSLPGLV